MNPLEKPTMDDAPEDIRDAVRQLKFAYQRSAEVVRGPKPDDAEPSELISPDTSVNDDAPAGMTDEQEALMSDALRRAEAVLFAAGEPMSAMDIASILPPGTDAAAVLMKLKSVYEHRGVSLVEVAGKWRFQTAPDLAFLFVEERQEQKKLSQAALETLAIIAYGQPVTRAEIEAVRGVAVSKGVIDTLMEAGWVKTKGRRQTPGRPVTFGTTTEFLEHFGLESLDVLPGKADLAAEGLLSSAIPEDFQMAWEQPDGAREVDKPAEETGDDAQFVTDFLGNVCDDDAEEPLD